MKNIKRDEIKLVSGAECRCYYIINGEDWNPLNADSNNNTKVDTKELCESFCCQFYSADTNLIISSYYFGEHPEKPEEKNQLHQKNNLRT